MARLLRTQTNSANPLNHEQIEQVAALFQSAPTVTEIEIRNNGVALRLRRAKPGALPPPSAAKAAPATAPAASAAASGTTKSAPAAAIDEDPIDIVARSGGELVTAHMVGVFRATRSGKTEADRAPIAPEAVVTEGQSLGNVETMRILNDCAAPVSGVVAHVYVSDGQPVEYGQVLFEIIPAPASNAESSAP